MRRHVNGGGVDSFFSTGFHAIAREATGKIVGNRPFRKSRQRRVRSTTPFGAEFLEARALLTENPASQMFTALNEEVAAGFKLGNDDIKAGYDAVKDVPTTFRNQFSNSKSWVNELPTITETGSLLNSSIIINFPTMTLEGPSFSSPTASAPTLGAGQAYPFYSGSNTAPYYSIYGSTGHASYHTATGVGQAHGYSNFTAVPSTTVKSETLNCWSTYSTGTPQTGAMVTVIGTYDKILVNGDRDSWSVNLNLANSQWNGTVSAASKHGPVSVSGNVTYSNGQLNSQSFSGSVAMENHILNVNYSKMLQNVEYHVTQNASYRNTVFENITLMADHAFDSEIGTRTSAGTGYWYSDKAYLGAIFASSAPLVGPATTEGTIFGAIPLNNDLLTLQTSLTITNQTVTNSSAVVLTEQIPSRTPFTFRTLFLGNYENFKDDWFTGIQIIYAP